MPGWLVVTAALLIGALLTGTWVVRVLSVSIDRVAFASVLKRFLEGDVPGRALRLAESAPGAPLAAAVRAALIACRDRIAAPAHGQSDYRSGGIDDSPEAVLTRLRAAYDRAFDETTALLRRPRVFALLGAASVCVALAGSWILDDVAFVFPFAAVGMLVLLLLVARIDRRFRQDRGALFESLADALYRTALSPDRFHREPVPGPVGRFLPPLTLFIREPGQEPRTVPVHSDAVEIGSFASAHVRLVSPSVAGIHAVIERTSDATTIVDRGSSAGTKVNGERVTRRALRHGDRVALGQADLRVELGESAYPR